MIGEDLTPRQWSALRAIVISIVSEGRPPTLRELGQWLGIGSTNGVADHLKALERKGYVERRALTSRGIAITERTRALFGGARQHGGSFVAELDSGASCCAA